ncbi:hypothetical protein, partial [Saccharothrix lopnurensis]
ARLCSRWGDAVRMLLVTTLVAGGAGMMGGAPMMAPPGQGGDGKDHQRKVRLEGEALVEEPPKASKPTIGE